MRNLKKVLALALATVMLLGMMAMASAADYKDEEAIADKYDVAVDVMTAIGVFEGDPEGNFNPQGELTREAAAKIAVYVALTKETAQHVAAVEAPFDDVAATRWSAGAIVAAKNLGLIDGLGNGKFDPQGDLTGYAFAKMLLGVLGYKASEEGFTGSGWEFNVNMAAAKAGLLKGLDASKLAKTMTREEAAHMALNALKAQPVTYVGGSSVTINGITITTGAQKEAEVDNEGEAYANLAKKLYPSLTWDTVVDNDFGYSTVQYKYGTPAKTVATAKNYTVLASYTGDLSALTSGALYTLTNKSTAAINVYVNGADTAVTNVTPADKGTAKVLANDTVNYTGAKVEVVKNDDVYEILVEKAEVVKVDNVVDATSSAKRKIQIAGCADVETEEYAKDQWIFVWKQAGETTKVIKHAAIGAADTAYGVINQVAGTESAATAVYVEGTKYTIAGSALTDIAGDTYDLTDTTKKTVVLVNGYAVDVIADVVTVAPSLANYVYVVKQNGTAVQPTWGTAEVAYNEAQVVYMDGTVATVKVDNADYNVAETGHVWKMTAKDNGTVKFDPVETKFNVDEDVDDVDFKEKVIGGIDTITKAYVKAGTKMLTVTLKDTGFVKTTKLADLPTEGTIDNVIVISSDNTDAYDVELVIAFGAVTVAPTDLYYVNGTVVSSRYDATAKDTYYTVNVYEVATGEKKTVETATVVAGLTTATVTDGIYAFTDATGTAYDDDETFAADKITTYKGLLTLDSTSYVDVDASAVKVIDTTGKGIDTVAKLVAKNDTKAVELTTIGNADGKLVTIIITDVEA